MHAILAGVAALFVFATSASAQQDRTLRSDECVNNGAICLASCKANAGCESRCRTQFHLCQKATPVGPLEDGPTRSYIEKMVSPDYSSLRKAYEASPQFDPAGLQTAAQRKAMKDAVAVHDFQTAVEKAALILEQHYTDVDANITSAFAYLQLGKPQLKRRHNDISIGLLKLIMDAGDGKSLDQAFETITIPEQFAVMTALRLRPVSQGILQQSGHTYFRVETTGRDGGAQTIYFQTDRLSESLATPQFFQLKFPRSIGGFDRAHIVSWEKQKPGLGHSVKYLGKGWNIDVIIYDRGINAIPDLLLSETVRREFDRSRLEVAQFHRATSVSSNQFYVKALDNTDRFICTSLSVGSPPLKTDDYLCLTGWGGKFVKFRVTSPRGDGTDQAIKMLLHAWMSVLWPELNAAFREVQTAFFRGDAATVARLAPPLADRGDPRAQILLGLLYKNGMSVKRDLARAYVLLSLAAAGVSNAERDFPSLSANLNEITAKMSAGEIAEAKKQVSDWKPPSDVPPMHVTATMPASASPAQTKPPSNPWPNIPTQIQQPKGTPNQQKRAIPDPQLDLKKLNVCRGC
jgi:hypothetical protein